MERSVSSELPRSLGLIDALAIVIGIVIGGGIFIVPNLVARELHSMAVILGVWVLAGLVSFFGGLACAELGAMLPATGGQYVFLREAWGPLVGFLCGWSMFLVGRTAQVAWLAVTLALYCSFFLPLSPLQSKLLGLAAIALFTAINYRGVTLGAAVQKLFTAAKLLGLLAIIGGAFLWSGKTAHLAIPAAGGISFGSFGVALIACMLAYDGWIQMSFVAGEIRNPQRNIFLALALGNAACIVVYLLANVAYMRVLSIGEIAASDHVGASVAERVFGSAGGGVVAIIIMVSIVGTLNGCFLTSPRLYFAQARDGLFLRNFGNVQPRFQTPGFAIIAQGLWAAVLVVSGSYETLVDYAMFALWLSYGVMVAGLIVLRRTQPHAARPYRMWGYPGTAVLFLVVTAWFLGNTLIKRPVPSVAGLLLIASGIPAYFLWQKRLHAASTAA
ncbi:MAG TPA: amino acid permease [Terriglobales bacterium]|nr:amino acid permease [Terriglobales bacterium]